MTIHIHNIKNIFSVFTRVTVDLWRHRFDKHFVTYLGIYLPNDIGLVTILISRRRHFFKEKYVTYFAYKVFNTSMTFTNRDNAVNVFFVYVACDSWPFTYELGHRSLHPIPNAPSHHMWNWFDSLSRKRTWHPFSYTSPYTSSHDFNSSTRSEIVDPCHLNTMRYLHIRTTDLASFQSIPQEV